MSDDTREKIAAIAAVALICIVAMFASVRECKAQERAIADRDAILVRAENYTGDTVALHVQAPPAPLLLIGKVPPRTVGLFIIPSAELRDIPAFRVTASTPAQREDSELYVRVPGKFLVLTLVIGDPPDHSTRADGTN